MKQFVRSVPAILIMSVASLSLIALVGCGGSGGGNNPGGGNNQSGPAAKNVYVLQQTYNSTTETEQDSVLVFSASATGSTAPTSTLDLPSEFSAYSLAVGPQGQIYVGGTPDDALADYGQILEYAAGSSGSVTPAVTLNGSATPGATFTFPYGLAVNSAGMLVVVSVDSTLETFASGFTASSSPAQYLTWGQSNGGCGDVGVDTAGEIFCVDNSPSHRSIEVFAAGATGGTAPVRAITGTDTNSFTGLENMAVDGAGDVYVANYIDPSELIPGEEPTEIIEFAAGASGNAAPLKRIGGTATKIITPWAVTVDGAGNLYYVDANGTYNNYEDGHEMLLEVFPSSASGNVAPAASITSSSLTFYGYAPSPNIVSDIAPTSIGIY